MAVDEEKTLFKNSFLPTEDDRLVLSFLEVKGAEVFARLEKRGYSRKAIADGFIHALTQWGNRP